MKTEYTAIFAHGENDTPGKLSLLATNDAEAQKEIKQFVETGYRGRTWATVELSDGRLYNVKNIRGNAFARIT